MEFGFHTPDVSTQAPTKAELGSPIKISVLSINVLWYQHLVLEEQHSVEVVLDEWGDVALERTHERPATPYLCMIDRVPVPVKKRQEKGFDETKAMGGTTI